MACEKCWGDAYIRSMGDATKSQGEHYRELLLEREKNPCSAHEQRGLAADPAQSAPSAEHVAISVANTFFDIDTMQFGRLKRILTDALEAYAALRTAKLDKQVSFLDETLADYIRQVSDTKIALGCAEAKVAQLERERDAEKVVMTTYFNGILKELGLPENQAVNLIYAVQELRTRAETAESALAAEKERSQKLEDALQGMFDSYDILKSLVGENPIIRGMVQGAFFGVESDRALLTVAAQTPEEK